MILPRCHTWLHLVPKSARFTTYGAPEFFARDLRDRGLDAPPQAGMLGAPHADGPAELAAPENPRGLVLWGNAAARQADLANCDVLVAVNVHGMRSDALRRASFNDIRTYAAIPNLMEPRWLLPLDNAAVATAGFCLYTPQRRAARLAVGMAKLLARTTWQFWYPHVITIAQKHTPPLVTMLQAALVKQPDDTAINNPTSAQRGRPAAPTTSRALAMSAISLAISTGAVGPDERRKPAMAVLDAQGHRLAFIKIAGSAVALSMLQHEAVVLPRLAALCQNAGHRDVAPRLLFSGFVDGTYMTVQSPVEGTPVVPVIGPPHHDFLNLLASGSPKPAGKTALVTALKRDVRTWQLPGIDGAQALAAVQNVLDNAMTPATMMHADFVPWNLRHTTDGMAAFDWDAAELDGLPLVDAMHHDLIVGHLLRHWTPLRASQYLRQEAALRPLGLCPEQVRAIQVAYILYWLGKLLGQGHTQHDAMVQWYAALCRDLANQAPERRIPHAIAG